MKVITAIVNWLTVDEQAEKLERLIILEEKAFEAQLKVLELMEKKLELQNKLIEAYKD